MNDITQQDITQRQVGTDVKCSQLYNDNHKVTSDSMKPMYYNLSLTVYCNLSFSTVITNMDVTMAEAPEVITFDMGIDNVLPSSQSSELGDEDLERMEKEAVPENTSRATKTGVKKFLEWSEKRNITVNFSEISPAELASILRRFYAEVKKDNGTPVSPGYLNGLRAAIQRYLTGAPFYRTLNIVSGNEFQIANKMFVSRNRLYYKGNNPKPRHKDPINTDDMKKLGTYFKRHTDDPVVLTEATWFVLCFYFGRRGREGWAELRKNHFIMQTSKKGEFITCTKTERIKNNQGGDKQSEQDYSTNEVYGPAVDIFKFFLSKLNPKCDRLFQYPVNAFSISKNVWFAEKPIGKNTLGNMMQRISEKSGLSKIYTCHCVRASAITALFQAGISPERIITITKHKNTSSLNHYVSGMSSDQKEECSSVLSAPLFGDENTAPTQVDEGKVAIQPEVDGGKVMTQPQVDGDKVVIQGVSDNSVSSAPATKFNNIFGNCTFQNCEFKFS